MIPTQLGNNVSIGSNATILPISICDGVVIGERSVDIKEKECCNPHQIIIGESNTEAF